MFKDLGQFKAYLEKIDSFDQLYIIQQGGRGVTREQIIRRLEKLIAQDAEAVFDANPQLWKSIGVSSWQDLGSKCSSNEISLGGLKVYFDGVIVLAH